MANSQNISGHPTMGFFFFSSITFLTATKIVLSQKLNFAFYPFFCIIAFFIHKTGRNHQILSPTKPNLVLYLLLFAFFTLKRLCFWILRAVVLFKPKAANCVQRCRYMTLPAIGCETEGVFLPDMTRFLQTPGMCRSTKQTKPGKGQGRSSGRSM